MCPCAVLVKMRVNACIVGCLLGLLRGSIRGLLGVRQFLGSTRGCISSPAVFGRTRALHRIWHMGCRNMRERHHGANAADTGRSNPIPCPPQMRAGCVTPPSPCIPHPLCRERRTGARGGRMPGPLVARVWCRICSPRQGDCGALRPRRRGFQIPTGGAGLECG